MVDELSMHDVKKRIVLGDCSHWWWEIVRADGVRATSPRVCAHMHEGASRQFVAGKSPQNLDLVHVAYVDLPFVERAVEHWPEGCRPVVVADGEPMTSTADLVDFGPCLCCGQARYQIRRCTCGHAITEHALRARGPKRGGCCALMPQPCDCRLFEEQRAEASRG